MTAVVSVVRNRKGLTVLFMWTLLASVVVLGAVDWPGAPVASAQCELLCEVPARSPSAQPVADRHLQEGTRHLWGILYVDCEATGANDGTSWDDAFVDLQLALDVAIPGDEIWVAAGTYYPSIEHGGTGRRYQSFQMLNGVGIYGGFDPSVGDTGWEDRDWEANETILSGANDNCFHVFFHPEELALDDTAILDGFTITGGLADGGGTHDCGAGMHNWASSPALYNCTFEYNVAGDYADSFGKGGGMYNYAAAPVLTNCTFDGNEGGQYYGYGGDGGGMYNDGDSSPALTDCTFSGNSAFGSGGGMYNLGSSPTLDNCSFQGNYADDGAGGGMHNGNSSSPTLTGCTFVDNWAYADGGGMHNSGGSSPSLTDCSFEDNLASGSLSGWGGGMSNWNSSPTLTDCTFTGNYAYEFGGGMHNGSGSSPVLTNCTFEGNYTDWGCGGGMSNASSSPTSLNCTFEDNYLAWEGAGMCNYTSSPTLTNCTFSGNEAIGSGGGIFNDSESQPTLTNSILWGDSPDEIYDDGSSPVVTYCNV